MIPTFFFWRYDDPIWNYIEWDIVKANWDSLDGDSDTTTEQKCLEFVKRHATVTTDPSKILSVASKLYENLFNFTPRSLLAFPSINESHVDILREMSILMSLNKVSQDGLIQNVSPAWFFPIACKRVFDLSKQEAEDIDNLYHSSMLYFGSQNDWLKAHTALGGILLHACQSVPDLRGGVVCAYGTNRKALAMDFDAHADEWINEMNSWDLKNGALR